MVLEWSEKCSICHWQYCFVAKKVDVKIWVMAMYAFLILIKLQVRTETSELGQKSKMS